MLKRCIESQGSKVAEAQIEQAIETAIIVSREIGMSPEGIKACLIAPFCTDPTQIEHIRHQMGDSIATILDGIISVQRLYQKNTSIKTDNFRNLLISFAKDMRVILLMIASCTNMMRKMSALCSEDREKHYADTPSEYTHEFMERIAGEASFLYAPLAHKLGLYKIKSELEDISLKILEHDAYYHIKEKLNSTKAARDKYIDNFIGPIEQKLKEQGLQFHIKGRTKSIHSIWQKMKKQKCDFEGVYDLFAIRIILDSPLPKEKAQCWQAYSIITDMYQPNPRRLRDWLSIPKSNGYESLHITVLGPEQKWVEVQIRTERMDDIAEHGLAAHWRYKGVKGGERGIESWLSSIRTALEEGDTMQMMDQFKTDLQSDEVYIFTPKGDLHKLIAGATVLDFAYSIHTNIGDHCTGAIVNEKNAPLRQRLVSGDQVTILTSANQTPKAAWLDYVVTGRAKSKIRQALNEIQTKAVSLAKEILERKFRNRKIELNGNYLNTVIKKMGYKDPNEFYRRVVDDQLDINDIIEQYQLVVKRDLGELDTGTPIHKADEFVLGNNEKEEGLSGEELVIDRNIKGLDYTLAKCCSPIYGDNIFGFVTINNGIRIHRTNCPNAAALRERYGYRIVKARWAGEGGKGTYPIVLHIVGNDDLGVVNNISSILSKDEKVNIRSFSIDSHDGLFEGTLTLMLTDTHQLDSIVKKLRTVKGVKNVSR
ncbi:MAG: bifunctional (p)ppGpp synthetase/guanosine-3',5'-bis(diphosphate) 3'-pyrophosphohydrolase [Bacteroidaceae bacterium]|nr:bifunctional (p)ppGpp synthetase/guanosine-3',5'-bis(diphosphate) 3'-pyrophosphohydrolase [Bacteroidaceae bacterium]MBR0274081.1 bifunctional (p)ppGpp synthetase/guanosine-3',5'-bis(diphosphate) 3'-pyrophosphohydrolase [Bacteroidaceae bacterium]